MATTTLRKLRLEDVEVRLTVEPEEVSHRGLERDVLEAFPGDPKGPPEDREADRRMREEICDRVRAGDDWAFGTAVVTVTWNGLEGVSALGHCSYRDADDFRADDGYYPGMVEDALEDLNSKVAAMHRLVAPLVEVAP